MRARALQQQYDQVQQQLVERTSNIEGVVRQFKQRKRDPLYAGGHEWNLGKWATSRVVRVIGGSGANATTHDIATERDDAPKDKVTVLKSRSQTGEIWQMDLAR